MTEIYVDLENNPYNVVIEKGILDSIEDHINLNRKVLVVTDKLVPAIYSDKVAKKCLTPVKEVIDGGEECKNLKTFEKLLKTMLENNFSRKDAVVAVGGGVVGDISGFAASCYMRGIDFYNVPTTVLSEVDSSVGGKTAVNLNNVKNIVGTFYQPKKVVIDPLTLNTLSKRQFSNGMAEVIKIAAVLDKDFFEYLENTDCIDIEYIISKAITLKKNVVVEDEKEAGLRKVLNFGHTIGHGIELSTDLYHGESIALGMLYMSSDRAKKRILNVMEKFNLPTSHNFDKEKAVSSIRNDKKGNNGKVTAVICPEIGKFEFKEVSFDRLAKEVM